MKTMKELLFQAVPILKRIGMCAAMALAMAACSDDSVKEEVNPDPNPDPTPEYPNEPVVNENVEMVAQMVAGFVYDADGNALSGVTVTTGNQRVTTDNSGLFYFQEIGSVSGRGVFRFSKDGYFDIVRSFDQTYERFDVVMYPKGKSTITASESFTATEGKDVEVSGMKVEIPASSLVDESGNAYSGQVQMDMIYMDPNNEHFADMMPGGDLSAIRSDNSSVQLVSYGMVGVNLTGSDGKKLQLKEGEQSTVTFPIPEGMGDDAPESMPLWHFNENAGIWVESGEAVRQGNEYVGTVGHFSYINLDGPKDPGEIRVLVYTKEEDDDYKDLEPLPGVKVHIWQSAGYTDTKGYFGAKVPADTPITVSLDDSKLPIDVSPYTYTVTVAPREIKTDTIIITVPSEGGVLALPRIKAKVVNDQGFVSVSARVDYDFLGVPQSNSMISLDGSVNLYYKYNNMGVGTVSITELGTGKLLYMEEVKLTGLNIDLGTINISSDTGLGGVFHVNYVTQAGNHRSTSINIPQINSTSGIMVVDDMFLATSYAEDSEDAMDVIFSGYSFDRTDYQNVFAHVEEGNKGFNSESLTASIVEEEENLFRIQLSGFGTFADGDTQTYDEHAELVSAEIVMPLLFAGKQNTHISSLASLDLPDFTPASLSTPDMAIMGERGTMCKQGGMLYYRNISYQDYQALVESIKQEGKLSLVYDDNLPETYGESVFMTDDKTITVSYDAGGLGDIFIDDPSYVMSVMIMDGIQDEVGLFSRSGKQIKKFLPFYRRTDKRNVRK